MCSLHVQKHIAENEILNHVIKLRFVDLSKEFLSILPQLMLNLLQAKSFSLSKILSNYNRKI